MAHIGTDAAHAAELLRNGGVVAIPTETVYGLAVNALNEQAVARVFEIKQRPSFNPLIVHVPGWAQVNQLAHPHPGAERLAAQFWPGPLTLVLPQRPGVPLLVTAGTGMVGVRAPRHPLAQQVLKLCGVPLAAPSANPSGGLSPTTAAHVAAQLGDRVDYILDGGPCELGLESTVVTFIDDKVVLLRPGMVTAQELAQALGVPLGTIITPPAAEGSTHLSPGMLTSHYAPRTPLRFWPTGAMPQPDSGVVLLLFHQPLPHYPAHLQRVLSPRQDLMEAAANLFRHLHELDALCQKMGLDEIWAEMVPHDGLGVAINDRLMRAAAR